jgi:hypothetical protein
MKGPFDAVAAGNLAITTVAPDTTNGNSFKCTGREILLINNGTGSPVTVTFTSAPDEFKRTQDIASYSIPISTVVYFTGGLTNAKGWKQSDGTVQFKVTGSGSTCAVIRLP